MPMCVRMVWLAAVGYFGIRRVGSFITTHVLVIPHIPLASTTSRHCARTVLYIGSFDD